MLLTYFSISVLSALFLAAQPDLPPLTEKVVVRAVNVDVTVTDSSGRPVNGLTADDFEVFEDGKPQAITGFYGVENATVQLARNPEQIPVAPTFRRKVVLMVDNNSIQRPPRDAALEFVEKFIDEEYDEKTEWSVMAVGSAADTLQSFTADKEQIRSGLLSARQRPTNTQQRQIDRDLLSDPVRSRLRDNPSSGYDFTESVRFQSQEQTARNLAAMKATARAVIQTCRAYGASSGRKALLLITGGMELNTSFGAFDSDRDRRMTDLKQEMERVLNTMVREANAANFKIYIIKAGGLDPYLPQHEVSNRTAGTGESARHLQVGEGFSRGSDSSNVDASSLTLALQTGGQYFPTAEVRKSIDRIDEDMSNFYSLAYVPQSPEDGQYHHLQVKVKRPGLTTRHRNGYVAVNSDQQLEQMLRAPLTFAKEKGALPVTLELGVPDTKDKSKPIIPVVAAVPIRGITLIPREGNYLGRVHVYLTIYGEQGNNVGFHHQVQDLRIPAAQMQQAHTQPFRYVMKVAMKKGNYTFVVTLRDDISGEIGTAFQELRI